MLSGAEGWCDIEEFGRTKLDWLRRYVPLANGIRVDDTIARIISAFLANRRGPYRVALQSDLARLYT